MGNGFLSVVLAMATYSMLNVGFVLQKKGASTLPRIESQGFIRNVANFFSNPTWLVGFVLTSAQYFLYLAAIGLGSISLVTPFSGFGIVVLVIVAYLYLHEPLSGKEMAGIGVVVAGVVCLGITAPDAGPRLTPETVGPVLGTPVSLATLGLLGVCIVLPLPLVRKQVSRHADAVFAAASGIASSVAAIFSNALMAFIDMGSIGSSLAAALGKPAFWFFAVMATVVSTVSTIYIQVAYQKGKASRVAPLYTIVYTVIPVIAGIIIFNEWARIPQPIALVRVVCIVVITAGAGFLASMGKGASAGAPGAGSGRKRQG